MPPEDDGKLIPPGTETVGEFAARHGVTPQTVRNWIRRGVIPARGGPADDGTRRPFTIETDAADAALDAHRRGNAHGGARRGAGRPTAKKAAKTAAREPEGPTLQPIEVLAEIGRRAEAGEIPDDGLTLTDLLNLRPEEIDPLEGHHHGHAH